MGRDDDRKDDDLLEARRPERGQRFDDADEHRGTGGQRIAHQPPDDGGDEALEADQEARVVEDRSDRRDQHARQGTHGGGDQEGELARQRGAHPDQARAQPVHGRRP
jgi:hypothetical protein